MNFAQIVRSSTEVRYAFSHVPFCRFWWRTILALHGKPINVSIHAADSLRQLSRGFYFYAYLYLGLAIFLLTAASFLLIAVNNFVNYATVGILSSVYLVVVSQLAFYGAKDFNSQQRNELSQSGRCYLLLVSFFLAIIAFLTFLSGIGITILLQASIAFTWLWLVGLFAVLTIGIGSYMIEVLFLVHHAMTRPDKPVASPTG